MSFGGGGAKRFSDWAKGGSACGKNSRKVQDAITKSAKKRGEGIKILQISSKGEAIKRESDG